ADSYPPPDPRASFAASRPRFLATCPRHDQEWFLLPQRGPPVGLQGWPLSRLGSRSPPGCASGPTRSPQVIPVVCLRVYRLRPRRSCVVRSLLTFLFSASA